MQIVELRSKNLVNSNVNYELQRVMSDFAPLLKDGYTYTQALNLVTGNNKKAVETQEKGKDTDKIYYQTSPIDDIQTEWITKAVEREILELRKMLFDNEGVPFQTDQEALLWLTEQSGIYPVFEPAGTIKLKKTIFGQFHHGKFPTDIIDVDPDKEPGYLNLLNAIRGKQWFPEVKVPFYLTGKDERGEFNKCAKIRTKIRTKNPLLVDFMQAAGELADDTGLEKEQIILHTLTGQSLYLSSVKINMTSSKYGKTATITLRDVRSLRDKDIKDIYRIIRKDFGFTKKKSVSKRDMEIYRYINECINSLWNNGKMEGYKKIANKFTSTPGAIEKVVKRLETKLGISLRPTPK